MLEVGGKRWKAAQRGEARKKKIWIAQDNVTHCSEKL
jgi:hypothetical protein